jgi:hypothetical protein
MSFVQLNLVFDVSPPFVSVSVRSGREELLALIRDCGGFVDKGVARSQQRLTAGFRLHTPVVTSSPVIRRDKIWL